MRSTVNGLRLGSFLATLMVWAAGPAVASAALLGPSEYLCFDDGAIADCAGKDSPFVGLSFSYFHLETFEDHLLNTPGVSKTIGSGVTSTVGFGGVINSIRDSVDEDDGIINGSGTNPGIKTGDSFFGAGLPGIEFSFSAAELSALPTHAGMVWTDGAGTTSFEAFGADGSSLGVLGPFSHADGTFLGTTADDRFYGVIEPGGISAIKLTNTSGGIEVDHLQYGLLGEIEGPPGPPPTDGVVPEPTSLLLFGLGGLGVGVMKRRRLV